MSEVLQLDPIWDYAFAGINGCMVQLRSFYK